MSLMYGVAFFIFKLYNRLLVNLLTTTCSYPSAAAFHAAEQPSNLPCILAKCTDVAKWRQHRTGAAVLFQVEFSDANWQECKCAFETTRCDASRNVPANHELTFSGTDTVNHTWSLADKHEENDPCSGHEPDLPLLGDSVITLCSHASSLPCRLLSWSLRYKWLL